MSTQTKAYLSLIFICIVWGTTYLAIKIGATQYPPFLFAGIRQVVSGAIIMIAGWLMDRNVDLSRKALLHQALVGFLMITLGNGLVTWAEQYVPSGVAALICGLMPLSAVIINLAISRGTDKLNLYVVLGLLLGVAGVALVFKDNLSDLGETKYILGIVLLLVATTSWAGGSIVNKRRATKTNPVFNSGLQLAFGGVFLLGGSPVVDNYNGFVWWHADGFWALLYLIVFGSVLAYTAYMYSLRKLPVGLVMMYAYVNPLVAVIIGWKYAGEPLTIWTAYAFIAVIGGVFLVNYGYKRQQKAREAAPVERIGTEELIERELERRG